MRTLRPAVKLEELTREMERYHWHILGLCEMRWKNFGKMSSDDRHKVYFSGEDRHQYGISFPVYKSIVSAVFSRLISIRLKASLFTVYAPTSGHDDNKVDNFYQQLQEIIDQIPNKDILVVQGDWNAKV